MDRSKSIDEKLSLLKKDGTELYKIRDKGVRGVKVYKRYVQPGKPVVSLTDSSCFNIPGSTGWIWRPYW